MVARALMADSGSHDTGTVTCTVRLRAAHGAVRYTPLGCNFRAIVVQVRVCFGFLSTIIDMFQQGIEVVADRQ